MPCNKNECVVRLKTLPRVKIAGELRAWPIQVFIAITVFRGSARICGVGLSKTPVQYQSRQSGRERTRLSRWGSSIGRLRERQRKGGATPTISLRGGTTTLPPAVERGYP